MGDKGGTMPIPRDNFLLVFFLIVSTSFAYILLKFLGIFPFSYHSKSFKTCGKV